MPRPLLNPVDYHLVMESIIDHEAFSPHPVPDAHGTLSIGYGRNLHTTGVSRGEATILLHNDIEDRLRDLPLRWPPFSTCDGPRQRVVIEMAYQLGVEGLIAFKHMLHAIAVGDVETAAQDVLASRLAQQTPSRARDYADTLREPPGVRT